MGQAKYPSDRGNDHAYSDENIALFLRNLQKKSLEDLLELQAKIAQEYAEANAAYEAERSQIRWEKRRYWMLIWVGVFKEIWRVLIKGKESNFSKIKHKKSELKEKHVEQDESYQQQLTLVQDSIATIQLYSNEISERMQVLADLKAVIEKLDAQLQQFSEGRNEDERLEIEQNLIHHIEDREILNNYIAALGEKTELLMSGLAGLVDNFPADYVPQNFLLKQRQENGEKIAALKQLCTKIKHPVIPKLLAFLERQTAVSLQGLQKAIATDPTLVKDRKLGDILWEVNSIYPAIFLEKTRENILFDYLALQEQKLATLQEVIELTDGRLQTEENPTRRQILDNLVRDRDALTAEISHLILLHRDILSDNHEALLDRAQKLARLQSDNVMVKDLQRSCLRLKQPVTLALHYFLTYRTERSLKLFKSLLETDATYFESRDIVRLIEAAGALDERVTQDWVCERELPSIQEIQQNYQDSVSDRVTILEKEYDTLTDERVEVSKELRELENKFAALDKAYAAITGITVRGYLPRAELQEIKKDAKKFKQYQILRQECIDILANIKMVKADLKFLNEEIERVETEQKKYAVEHILFTPELMNNLVAKCGRITRLGRIHPVADALVKFLNYPTPSVLNNLQRVMQKHPDYQKNENLMHLLQEANRYFPYIQRESHPIPAHKPSEFHFFKGEIPKDHSVLPSAPRPKFGGDVEE